MLTPKDQFFEEGQFSAKVLLEIVGDIIDKIKSGEEMQ
jgi:hypothetical protein